MSRFLVWSDLHAEIWGDIPRIAPRDDIDGLLIAGDLHTKTRHVDMALLAWDMLRVPVVMVRGNHEFYGSEMSEIVSDDRRRIEELQRLGAEIHLLEGTAVEVAGTRIVGATLWTGFDLFPGRERQARDVVEDSMNDFVEIRTNPVRRISSGEMIEMHLREKEAIQRLVAQPWEGQTIVMTHHLPVFEAVHPKRLEGSDRKRLSMCGYASDMWRDIRLFDIHTWVSGHSHDPVDLTMEGDMGDIRFVSNPRGYPKEEIAFDPNFTIDVARPHDPDLMPDLFLETD